MGIGVIGLFAIRELQTLSKSKAMSFGMFAAKETQREASRCEPAPSSWRAHRIDQTIRALPFDDHNRQISAYMTAFRNLLHRAMFIRPHRLATNYVNTMSWHIE